MNNHRLAALIVGIFVGVLFAALQAPCQSFASAPTTPENNTLPTAPIPHTCTGNNGKPCRKWVEELVASYPPSPKSAASNLPPDPNPVHFYTYRGWEDPPLRNNREVFRSRFFDTTHLAGMTAMIVACHRRNSGETCGSGAIVVGAIFGMDYLQFRFVGGPNAIGAPIYEVIHYARASAR